MVLQALERCEMTIKEYVESCISAKTGKPSISEAALKLGIPSWSLARWVKGKTKPSWAMRQLLKAKGIYD